MKSDNFIYKILLLLQTGFTGILLTKTFLDEGILVFSKVKNIYLFEFVLSSFSLTLLMLFILLVLSFLLNKFLFRKKKKDKGDRKRLVE